MTTAPTTRRRTGRAARRHVPLHRARSLAELRRVDPREVVRLAAVVGQAMLLHLTWPLWQDHQLPPTLPIVSGLPGLSMGWLLLASLVPVVVRPRWGIPVHVGLLVLALSLDQMRLRPEWITLAVVLLAAGRWRWSPTLAWSALSSLWLWAGLTKAASTGYVDQTVGQVVGRWGIEGLRPVVAVLIPLVEVGVGLAAAWPRTRRWAGWAAGAVHVGIIVVLGMGWDWPILWWNVVLAIAAVGLLALGPAEHPPRSPRHAGARTALVVFLFAYPATSYLGLVDPYLSHHVYTGDLPRAELCDPSIGCSTFGPDVAGAALKTTFPNAPRLYRQWFQEVCVPGQTLRITGLQVRAPLDRLAGAARSEVACHRT